MENSNAYGERECLRCGHRWINRKPTLPRVCPRCTSPYWNIKKSQERQLEQEKQDAAI